MEGNRRRRGVGGARDVNKTKYDSSRKKPIPETLEEKNDIIYSDLLSAVSNKKRHAGRQKKVYCVNRQTLSPIRTGL